MRRRWKALVAVGAVALLSVAAAVLAYSSRESRFAQITENLRLGMSPKEVADVVGGAPTSPFSQSQGDKNIYIETYGEDDSDFTLLPNYILTPYYDPERRLTEAYWTRFFLIDESHGKVDIK